MSGIPHRCAGRLPNGKRCLKRHTFKRPWTQYAKWKQCDRCGYVLFWIEEHRRKHLDRNKCVCNGYPFPHQLGGLWCYARSPKLPQPTPEDYAIRFGGHPSEYGASQ